ncbi:MAG: DEAD/DEAH box helicase [Gracilibacteraceae bacterium]|jgi:superfamily II RNA helicase|nr:DEAD/DEAH box helicase [Gracilibacteraceae bacterium]
MEFHGFTLDKFQAEAVAALERGESVIVSAPTGTGKTLVADYLAEKMLGSGRRVIYTAPIKALSNQKFKDFTAQFGSEQVGIMTGDVVMNPEAPLLLMTTEVFRNQVLEDDPKLREIAWVIFDEIHWLSDEERGTVWEEAIILAPAHIRFLGLSATIANASELARWIEEIRSGPVALIEEHQRVVPLSYYYYTRETGFTDLRRLEAHYRTRRREAPIDGRTQLFPPSTHIDLITAIERNYLPCLYFVFSRKGCGEKALALSERRTYLQPDESADVCDMFRHRLGPESEWSASTRALYRVCERGIGYHHAGLLPLQKALVEDLFFARLIHVMYCTETFSVGINYPVRAVCFDALYKYDGRRFRPLANHEFFQMSGRAGRRGLDARGFSFALVDLNRMDREPPLEFDIKWLEPLFSRFRLSYNTVLNLVATLNPEQIKTFFQKSFAAYAGTVIFRDLLQEKARLEEERDRLNRIGCELAKTYRCPLPRRPKLKELARMKKTYGKYNARQRRKINARELKRRIGKWEAELAVAPSDCGPEREERCRAARPQQRENESALAAVTKKTAFLADGHDFPAEFARKKKELQKLGYLEGDVLAPRGRLARSIYVQELFVTEFLFSGLADDLDDPTLCGLIACIDYEQKRNDNFLRTDLLEAGPIKQIMFPIEQVCGFDAVRFDHRVANVAHAWSSGTPFTEVQKMCNLDEGDIISLFRRTIDLLRQMKEAVTDPRLAERLRACIRSMDRDEAEVVEI